MPDPSWMDKMVESAGVDFARVKDVMHKQINRPVRRQPPIRNQVMEAVANPQAYPADARARLASQLYAKYGEQARNVAPYLLGDMGEETNSIGEF